MGKYISMSMSTGTSMSMIAMMGASTSTSASTNTSMRVSKSMSMRMGMDISISIGIRSVFGMHVGRKRGERSKQGLEEEAIFRLTTGGTGSPPSLGERQTDAPKAANWVSISLSIDISITLTPCAY